MRLLLAQHRPQIPRILTQSTQHHIDRKATDRKATDRKAASAASVESTPEIDIAALPECVQNWANGTRGQSRVCLSQLWVDSSFVPSGSNGASGAVSSSLYSGDARMAVQHSPTATSFVLRSELIDSTLETETIVVRLVYHVLCPIIRPNQQTAVAADDRASVREYLDLITAKINASINLLSEEFDNADFDKERLFSINRNRSPGNALHNQRIYSQLMAFSKRMNILFEVQHDECDYIPDWDDFNSPDLDNKYKARLRNSLGANYRDYVDPVVKGYQLNPDTNKYDLPTGLGAPAKNPDQALHIWVVDFPVSGHHTHTHT